MTRKKSSGVSVFWSTGDLGVELDVELEAADAREVVRLASKNMPSKSDRGATPASADRPAACGGRSRSCASLGVLVVSLRERVDEHGADEIPVREEDLDLLDAALARAARRRPRAPSSLASKSTSPVSRSTTSARKQRLLEVASPSTLDGDRLRRSRACRSSPSRA